VKPPDLAVIIPARNEAPRIGGCLDSIHQALEYAGVTAAEVIVVDDESTDETSPIARAHGAVAVRQSPRGGPLAAWTFGVANSSAPLLFFVDADCLVDHAAFAALLRGFARSESSRRAATSTADGSPIRSWNARPPSALSCCTRSSSVSPVTTSCRSGS
jgi:glycosyltransferase involved in cell wall biosynthesis